VDRRRILTPSYDDFAKEFPHAALERGPRFVDNGRGATAGGLTSGIDMTLHVVKRCFGDEVAARPLVTWNTTAPPGAAETPRSERTGPWGW